MPQFVESKINAAFLSHLFCQPLNPYIPKSHIAVHGSEKLGAGFIEALALSQISLQTVRQPVRDRDDSVLAAFALSDEQRHIFQINIGQFQIKQFALAQSGKQEGGKDRMVAVAQEMVIVRIIVHHFQKPQRVLFGKLGRQALLQTRHLDVLNEILLHVFILNAPSEENSQRLMVSDKSIGGPLPGGAPVKEQFLYHVGGNLHRIGNAGMAAEERYHLPVATQGHGLEALDVARVVAKLAQQYLNIHITKTLQCISCSVHESREQDSNPRPALYKSAALPAELSRLMAVAPAGQPASAHGAYNQEPLSGLEPETYSFASTSISCIRGLDCILSLSRKRDLAPLVSRSGPHTACHGLTLCRALTVIRETALYFYNAGRRSMRSTMELLYQLSYNGVIKFVKFLMIVYKSALARDLIHGSRGCVSLWNKSLLSSFWLYLSQTGTSPMLCSLPWRCSTN